MGKNTTARHAERPATQTVPVGTGDSPGALGGELPQHAGGAHPGLTTNQGAALSDNQHSLKANPRGPTLPGRDAL